MKYGVVTVKVMGDDEFTELITQDKAEAIDAARDLWATICDADKKTNRIEVREYVEDIEEEDCTCFDYDLIEW